MDRIRVRSLQWATGSFFAMIGTLLLIAPHQFSAISFPLLDQYHYGWALAFLLVGVTLIGITLLTPLRRSPVQFVHALAALLLFSLSAAYARDGVRIGTINYVVLGLGLLVSIALPRSWRRDLPPATADLFTIQAGLAVTITGVLLLAFRFTSLNTLIYGLSPAMFLGFGVALAGSGTWLLAAELLRHRRAKAAAQGEHARDLGLLAGPWSNWTTSLVLIAFLLVTSLPTRLWISAAYYGVTATILTLLPWIESYLERFPPTSLRFRMAVLLTSAAALPLILTVAWNGYQEERFIREETLVRQESLARAVAADLSNDLRSHQAALRVLAGQPGLMDLAPDGQRRQLAILSEAYPQFTSFSLYDADGLLLVDHRGLPGGISIAGDPDYLYVRRNLQPDMRIWDSPTLGQPVLRFTMPILDADGDLAGLVASEIDVSALAAELSNQGAATSSQVYVVDGSGQVIVYPDANTISPFQQLSVGAVVEAHKEDLASSSGSLSYQAGGEEHLAGYARVPGIDWGVIVERRAAEALAGVYNARIEAFELLVLFLVLASLAGGFLSGWLIGPLTSLSRAVGGMAEGEDTIPLPRTDFFEIQQLVAAFGQMRLRLAERTAERERALAKLHQARSELEMRVTQRTAELSKVNAELEEANRELQAAKWDLEFELAERRELEERLAYQALVLENVHDAVIATDEHHRITAWNPGAEILYGWRADEVLGYRIDEILPTVPAGDQAGASLFIDHSDSLGDVLQYRKDGSPVFVTGNTITLWRSDGGIGGYVATNRDVTARKLAEQALAESERRLRTVLEYLPAGVWLADASGRIVYGNPAAHEIWGRDRFVGMDEPPKIAAWWAETGEPLQPEDWASFRAIRRGETSLNEVIEIESSDGRHKVIRNSAVPIVDGRQEILGAVILNEDITESREAEVALAESEARERARAAELEALMDAVPAIVLVARDPQCRVITGNYFAYDLMRAPYGSNLSLTAPEGEASPGYRLYVDDGEIERDELPMQVAASTGVQVNDTRQKIVFENGEVRYIFGNVTPLLDDHQRPRGAIGAFIDVTPMVEAEQAASEYAARLERSNRDLEDFAFIASHDLQEPLRKVKAFSDLLQLKYGEQLGQEGCDFLERMRDASSRMKEMIDDLMSFSRVATQPRTFSLVDLNQVVHEVIADLEFSLQQNGGQVHFEELPVIRADPVQIHQLLLNLVSNGLKFSQPGRPPVVKVSAAVLSREELPAGLALPGNPSRQYVQIRVEDNGIGFEEKFLERIFQPFQRLHGRSQYPGSGIGLAICRKIVEQHSGAITAHSAPGQGSTFVITLPFEHVKAEFEG